MTMMNTVLDQIQRMDNDELNRVAAAVKAQRTYNARNITRKLLVGDIVGFDAKSRGYITGRVKKVNPKTVLVTDSKSGVVWKVSATLLEPAATEAA